MFLGVCSCVQVCGGMRGCRQVCVGVRMDVCRSVWKCAGVCKCMCGMNFQNKYLLENRVYTSADFNTYPIGIFFSYLVSCISS